MAIAAQNHQALKARDRCQSIPDLERTMLSEFRLLALPHVQRNIGNNLWE